MMQIRPVLGLKTHEVPEAPPSRLPKAEYGLEFLQHNDVFFSDQSVRAQLTRFLNNPKKPLMFSYTAQDPVSLSARLWPSPYRDVILLSPPPPAPEIITSTPPGKSASRKNPFASAPKQQRGAQNTDAFNAILAMALDEPTTSSTFDTTEKPPTEDEAEFTPPKPFSAPILNEAPVQPDAAFIRLTHITGELIKPHYYQMLDHGLKATGRPWDNTPVWVRQTADTLIPLPGNRPEQAGYQAMTHPFKTWALYMGALALSKLFGLKHTDQHLLLPGGRVVTLNPVTWKDPQGQTAKLFQVVPLPDGRWLKVIRTASEHHVEPDNRKHLKTLVENQITQLEQAGKIRELATAPSSSVMPAQPPALQATPAAGATGFLE